MVETARTVRDVIFDTVAAYFDIPREGLTDATTAQDIAKWDSVSHIPLMLEIEEKLNIEFPLERLGSVENLGDLIVLGEEFIAEQQPS